jgi:hypothetical protein
MPCSICCEHGHNSKGCWNVCLPLYFDNDLKVKNTISKMDEDGRRTAKRDEDIRVEWICDNINNDTDIGEKIKIEYYEKFNKIILYVEKKGGNNIHYDILIYHEDGTFDRCEEKGTKKVCGLNKLKTPWEKSVQRYNGTANWAEKICKIYARVWYDKIVNNSDINIMIGNSLDIPSFEEWWCDCKSTDPITMWGKENKKLVREKWGERVSLNTNKGGLIDGRVLVIEDFKKLFTDDIKVDLMNLIQAKINDIMSEKDVWITTCGEVPNIEYRLWDKIPSEKIKDINLKYSKGSDIIFECICENENNFDCYLRWGKGCGFSNMRLDIR